MSSMKMGLRRVGVVGLSTLVVTSMMSLSDAPAFAAAAVYAQESVPAAPNVLQGGTNQAAGNLSLTFDNAWLTAATQTFTIAGGAANVCDTAAHAAAAVSYSAVPVLTVTDADAVANDPTDTKPAFTAALTGTGTGCNALGILNTLTITQTPPSTGLATDRYKLTLSGIKYNVGTTTALGAITATTAGSFLTGPTGFANATVGNATFTSAPRVAALPSTTASVGTQTFTESTAGAYFPLATQHVLLTLGGGGTFTDGVTPTITVPTGYLATHPVTAGTVNHYTFDVTGIAAPIKATVTVSGLTADVDGTVAVRTLTATGMNTQTPPAVKVINVVTYNARTGGATRYETAAALFNSIANNHGFAVLARGDLYPDALSANYLAGRLGTGTLLTPVATLSSAARLSILNGDVETVYITGGTGAVSQAVQNQIEALHVGNVAAAAFITTVRLGGADRYATNLLVNENAFTPETTVLLASGLNFPDALAFGPIASKPGNPMPLILTRGTTLGTHELAQLSDFGPTNVVIGGGTGVVSAAIATSLAADYTVLRLAGADRTLTAAAIATWATVGVGDLAGIKAAQGFHSDTTYIGTGNLFPDSLAAGPVAGATDRLILLTYSGLGAGIPSYLGLKAVDLAADGVTVGTLHALGLTGAVSAAVMKSAAATIGL